MAYPVKTLIVDTCPKHGDREASALLFELCPLLCQYAICVLPHEIHLMHEQEYFGIWAIFLQSIDTVAIIVEIFESFSRFDIEDVDQYRNVLEYR